MTRSDRNTLFITFCVGFVSGVYFYFAGFSFEFEKDLPEEEFYTDFSIEGEAYGNCIEKECFAFQLLADGSYRLTDDVSGQSVVKDGIITKELRSKLLGNLDVKSLDIQAKLSNNRNCASDDGGIDYKFLIVKDGKEYVLDSCKTMVDFKGKSWLTLSELWDYFAGL